MSLSYSEDVSVKIAESASLLPSNLTVLRALEEGGLAYGVASGHLATVTYVAPDSSTSESKTVDFSGSGEDSSSKSLTSVSITEARVFSSYFITGTMVLPEIFQGCTSAYILQRI